MKEKNDISINSEKPLVDIHDCFKGWNNIIEDNKNTMVDVAKSLKQFRTDSKNQIQKLYNQIEILRENWKVNLETIKKEFKEFSDKNKLNFYIAKEFLENNPQKVDEFIERKIWPPIFYFLDRYTIGDLIDGNNKEFSDINIDKLIQKEDVREYYYKSMSTWIEDEQDPHIKKLIKEIQINFEINNIYVTTLSLFTLLEYKVDKARPLKQITKKYAEEYKALKDKGYKEQHVRRKDDPVGITRAIEIIIYENCFGYKDSEVLDKLYDVFFNKKGDCYLYKDTEKDPGYITRHMLHGKKIDLITEERMMSLVFLIDSIHKMLISEEKINRK